jgi:hypothetical protein
MDGCGLLTLDHHRQARVDGVLDRCSSLAKNRNAVPVPTNYTLTNHAVLGRTR